MNERIRELAEQAKQETSLYGGKPGDRKFDERFNKMFAKLIVKECIWAFGETRTEPSLEKYILDRLGINNE